MGNMMSTLTQSGWVHADLSECTHPENCTEENHFFPGGAPNHADA